MGITASGGRVAGAGIRSPFVIVGAECWASFVGPTYALNRPIYVTDSPDLVVSGAPDLYRTVGLVDGAIDLTDSEESTLVSDIVTGLENLVGRMQGEFAYNLGLLGAKWDSANGGANPNAAAVGTAANWDQVATDMKDGPGVVIISG